MRFHLIFTCAVFLLVGCETPEDTFREREMIKVHAENARRAYDAGQYDRAAHQATKALEYDSDYANALAVLGYTYLQVARFSREREPKIRHLRSAEENLKHLIDVGSETDPAVFKGYFGLGLVYFMWAQEVKAMIRESEGESPPLVVEGGPDGAKEELWNE